MPLNNTMRACVLAGLIALGSAVSGEASTASNPLLGAVQSLVTEGASVITSFARQGIEAVTDFF